MTQLGCGCWASKSSASWWVTGLTQGGLDVIDNQSSEFERCSGASTTSR